MIILAAVKPSEQEMLSHTSPAMQKMIEKDASLVFAISLMDITTISKTIMTSEGPYLVFVPALVTYLIITAIFSFVFEKIEKRFSLYE